MKAVRNTCINRALKVREYPVCVNQPEILSRSGFKGNTSSLVRYLSLDGSQIQSQDISAEIHHSWLYLLRWPSKYKLSISRRLEFGFQIHIPFVGFGET